MLPDSERRRFSHRTPAHITPQGEAIPLGDVVHFEARKGVDLLRRVNGELAVTVYADLDPDLGNANEIIATLNDGILPELQAKYGIGVGYEGKPQEQAENMQTATGAMLGLALIHVVLAGCSAPTRAAGDHDRHLLRPHRGGDRAHSPPFGTGAHVGHGTVRSVRHHRQRFHRAGELLPATGGRRHGTLPAREACVRRLRAVLSPPSPPSPG